MSLISVPNTFTVGAVIVASQHNSNFSIIYSDYNGNITDVNIASNASIADSKLAQIITAGKSSGASFTSLSSIPVGAGIIPIVNIPALTSFTQYPYIKCSNTQNSGTNGGTATLGAWRTITLNTKDSDTSSIATLASNQISLPSGTYLVQATNPFVLTGFSSTRLQNITDGSTILNGTPATSNLTNTNSIPSFLKGIFTIAATKTIEYQYQTANTQATNGLGQAVSFGTEVFAIIEFTKVS